MTTRQGTDLGKQGFPKVVGWSHEDGRKQLLRHFEEKDGPNVTSNLCLWDFGDETCHASGKVWVEITNLVNT